MAGRRSLRSTVIVALVLLTVSACGFNPGNYALPGTGVRGSTYTVKVQFSSVLNLPPGANVSANGATVGTMKSADLQSDQVTVAVKIKKSVHLPVGTRAELRQTTILGDIYIALIPPENAAGPILHNGDTIPLSQTDPGPQIEDVLKRLATFISGGSIQALQNSMDRLNQALPANPAETRSLSSEVAKDLAGAANDINDVESILRSTEDLTKRLVLQQPTLAQVFSDEGNYRLEQTSKIGNSVFEIVVRLQDLTNSMTWLLPRLPTINAFLDKVVPLVRAPSASALQFNGNIGLLISLFKNKLIPFITDGPSVNITGLQVGGHNSSASVMAVLKMIGAVQ